LVKLYKKPFFHKKPFFGQQDFNFGGQPPVPPQGYRASATTASSPYNLFKKKKLSIFVRLTLLLFLICRRQTNAFSFFHMTLPSAEGIEM
jgi:hypothetical protein